MLSRLRRRRPDGSATIARASEITLAHANYTSEPPPISKEAEFSTFHPFSRLPIELRCLIWSFTRPQPHVIEIVWSGKEWQAVAASRAKPNNIIQASKEAYQDFLLKWQPFCKHQASDTASLGEHPLSYISPEIDTVYIGGHPFNMDCFSDEALEALVKLPGILQLRHLAMEISEWYEEEQVPGNHEKNWEIDFLALFPNLELFTIADYDLDREFIHRSEKRPIGEVTLVDPIQIQWTSELEMWPKMERRLNQLRKLPEGEALPKTQVKEVLRGSVRMEYNIP